MASGDVIPDAQVWGGTPSTPTQTPGSPGRVIPDTETWGAQPIWSGSVLPVSQYPGQPPRLDWSAGIPGQIASAFALPSDVMTGNLQLGSPESISRLTGAAALATPGVPGLAEALTRVNAPSAEALTDIASQQYDAARGLGVHYTVPSVVDHATNTIQSLYGDGFHPVTQPKTFGLLSALTQPPKDAVSVPLTAVESARRVLSKISTDRMDSERFAAGRARSAIDNFIENPAPGNVAAGDAGQAAQLMKAGRGNWAAAQRSETLTSREEKAGLQERPTGDALRGYLTTLLDPTNKQRLAGFTPAEREAITTFVQGTPTQNVLRLAGRTFAGSGGEAKPWWAIAGGLAGEHFGGGPAALAGAAIPYATGVGANALRDALAARSFRNLDEFIRSRSPAYQATPAAPTPLTGALTPWEQAVGRGAIGGLGLTNQGVAPVVLPPRPPAYRGVLAGELFD